MRLKKRTTDMMVASVTFVCYGLEVLKRLCVEVL